MGCKWEYKNPETCNDIPTSSCPEPNWTNWPSGVTLDCKDAKLTARSLKKMTNQWRKRLKNKNKSLHKCATVCADSNLKYVGEPAKCSCKQNQCNWMPPIGTCEDRNVCILPKIENVHDYVCNSLESILVKSILKTDCFTKLSLLRILNR